MEAENFVNEKGVYLCMASNIGFVCFILLSEALVVGETGRVIPWIRWRNLFMLAGQTTGEIHIGDRPIRTRWTF